MFPKEEYGLVFQTPFSARGITFIAIAQSILLTIFQSWTKTQNFHPTPIWQMAIYYLLCLLPAFLLLYWHKYTLPKRDALEGLGLFGLAWLTSILYWIGYSTESKIAVSGILFVSLAIALAVVIRRSQNGRHGVFKTLFQIMWLALLSLAFLGLMWLLLGVVVYVFRGVGIDLSQMVEMIAVGYSLGMFTLGIGLVLKRSPILDQLSTNATAILAWIFPVLSAISLVLAASIPFGSSQQGRSGFGSAISFLCFGFAMLVFCNVWVHSSNFRENLLNKILRYAPVVVVVFGIAATQGVWFRVRDLGWTEPRVLAIVVAILEIAAGVGYFLRLESKRVDRALLSVNHKLLWSLFGITCLFAIPLFTPVKLAYNSQLKILNKSTDTSKLSSAWNFLRYTEYSDKILKLKADFPNKVWPEDAVATSPNTIVSLEAVNTQAKAFQTLALAQIDKDLHVLYCDSGVCAGKIWSSIKQDGLTTILIWPNPTPSNPGFNEYAARWFTAKEGKLIESGFVTASVSGKHLDEDAKDVVLSKRTYPTIWINKAEYFLVKER